MSGGLVGTAVDTEWVEKGGELSDPLLCLACVLVGEWEA